MSSVTDGQWHEQCSRILRGEEPAEFTVRALVELLHD
jgi:hypothetical protein